MRAMKFKIARSDRFVAIATQSHGVDLLNKTLKTITITCLQLIPLHRPYRCCVLSKNVSQLLFQLLSWSEDNTKALVRFFGSAHQRYDYTWFIVLIVFVFLVICKTWWKATSTLKRISIILKWFETQFSTHRMLPHQLTKWEFNRWFTLVLLKRYWRPEKILTFLCGKDNLKLLFCFGRLAGVCFTWVKTPILALLMTSLVKLGTYRKNRKKQDSKLFNMGKAHEGDFSHCWSRI